MSSKIKSSKNKTELCGAASKFDTTCIREKGHKGLHNDGIDHKIKIKKHHIEIRYVLEKKVQGYKNFWDEVRDFKSEKQSKDWFEKYKLNRKLYRLSKWIYQVLN